MARKKSSSTEDAQLVEELASDAGDTVDTLTETHEQLETQVDETFDELEARLDEVQDDAPETEHQETEHQETEYQETEHQEAEEWPDEEVHEQVEETYEEPQPEVVYEEERRSSLASRFLWLLLLLLGGAGLALWGGPKLAPMLPQPLQPLAKYLTPGASEFETNLAEVSTEIATLRSDTEAQIGALPAPVPQTAIEEAIASAVSAAAAETEARVSEQTNKLAADLAALSDQVAAADSGEIEGRLATIETKIAGMSTEFASLQQALGALEASDGEENPVTAELTAELTARMAGYAASLDGLKAEVAEVATQNGEVRQRIDEVEAATARQLSEADARVDARIKQADARAEEMEVSAEESAKAAEIEAAMRKVRSKLDNGAGFGDELSVVAAASGVEIPDVLTQSAEGGIPTVAALESDYGDAATAAIRVAVKAEAEDGTVSGLSAFLKSQVVSRSLSPQEGDSTDAVLSRMEAGFKNGDLATTLAEAEALPAPAAEAMADWLSKARTRAEALTGFDALTAALAQN